jgi:hypothetical protein
MSITWFFVPIGSNFGEWHYIARKQNGNELWEEIVAVLKLKHWK